MPDAHYCTSRLAEIYDLDSPWSVDREFYLALAGSSPQGILDLGCGTGLLCNAFADKDHDVTGVDPAPQMLAVARRKPQGKKIDWIQSSAQKFRSHKLFDLVIMTGHAFQVLLEDEDVRAAFMTMRRHVKPDGLIAFESRNPAIDWSRQWNYDMKLQLPGYAVYESRRFLFMHEQRMKFELRYQFPDEQLVSESELLFLCRSEIEQHLQASDLRIEKVLGDWDGREFDEASSPEMIFLVRAALPDI